MTTALQQSPNKQVEEVRTFLNRADVQKQMMKALPKHLTPERMVRIITTAITNTPKLAMCTRDSLIAAIVETSTLGLEPNTSLGESYLIPYGNQVKLIIGYRGFIKLALRSGKIVYAVSEIVYANDNFRITLGTNRQIIHEPLLSGDRGTKVGVYSLVQYTDGMTDFEYMSADDVDKIKKRSKASSDGPWKTDEGEMWRKTPMRRHAKRWPLSPEEATRIAQDEYTDYGLSPTGEPEPEKPTIITQEQRQAIVAAAKRAKVATPVLSELLKTQFGFELLANITVDRYDEVLYAVENYNTVDAESDPAETEPEVSENVSEVTADTEAETSVVEKLRGQIKAIVEAKGFFELSKKTRDELDKTPVDKCDDPTRLTELLTMVGK